MTGATARTLRPVDARTRRAPLLDARRDRPASSADGRRPHDNRRNRRACVLEHALAGRARRVLIVTDGYVGRAPVERVRAAERAGLEIRVLLTPGGWRRDLEPLAARIQELPETGAKEARRNP